MEDFTVVETISNEEENKYIQYILQHIHKNRFEPFWIMHIVWWKLPNIDIIPKNEDGFNWSNMFLELNDALEAYTGPHKFIVKYYKDSQFYVIVLPKTYNYNCVFDEVYYIENVRYGTNSNIYFNDMRTHPSYKLYGFDN